MRVLVVGGAGYIGSVVGARLIQEGHQVAVLDDLSTGHRDAVPEGAELFEAPIHYPKVLHRALEGVEAVLHFGARSQVGESTRIPEVYWQNNLGGTMTLLAAMRERGIARLVFSSTAAVYGEPQQLPIDELHPTSPTSPYGNTKLAADLMIRDQCSAHQLAAVSLRYFNVAGAALQRGERHQPETHLIPLLLEVALGERGALTVYGTDYPTADGTCIRDYIHVDDLATAHLLALDATSGAGGRHLVYNLGNGRGFSVLEVVAAARQVTGAPIEVVFGPRRPGDPAVLVASSDLAQRELGWSPRRPTLEEMIQDAFEFRRQVASR
ncbi:MAG: UDP-glucose 4-epimerase GalE [Candidatus Dormibacteria bacterium]